MWRPARPALRRGGPGLRIVFNPNEGRGASLPDARFPLAYKEASAQADPATQTYSVFFSFAVPEGLTVLPGMTVDVIIPRPGGSGGAEEIPHPRSPAPLIPCPSACATANHSIGMAMRQLVIERPIA